MVTVAIRALGLECQVKVLNWNRSRYIFTDSDSTENSFGLRLRSPALLSDRQNSSGDARGPIPNPLCLTLHTQNNSTKIEIWGLPGVCVDSALQDCYAMQRLTEHIPTQRRHLQELTDARRSHPALEDGDVFSFETSGNVKLSATQRNIPEDLNPQYRIHLWLVCTSG
jgi:hypothetical protein